MMETVLTTPPVVDAIASILREETLEWPRMMRREDEQRFVALAAEHRVQPLLFAQLSEAGVLDEWPEHVRAQLACGARDAVICDAIREAELRRVLPALASARVDGLLLKGAALAYTHYFEPWQRPRVDTDLLVRSRDVHDAQEVLRSLTYQRSNELSGDYVSYQIPWVRDHQGVRHVIDLHWKTNNRAGLTEALSFDELWAAARSVPEVDGRVPGDIHALLLACVHRVTHHRNTDHLLWCYDVHLLASGLSPAEFDDFVALAVRKRFGMVCAAGLQLASTWFHTVIPDGVLERLAVENEPSSAYLRAAAWHGDVRLWDFRRLQGWRAKAHFVREVALPDANFMLREYGCSTKVLLPLLHVHRIARGTWRLLRRM